MTRASAHDQNLERICRFSAMRRSRTMRLAALTIACLLAAAPAHALWWHWPIHRHKKPPAAASKTTLHGYVATTARRQAPSLFEKSLNDAIADAELRDGKYRSYKRAADKFSTRHRRITARLADTLDYTFMFRGISPSSEAGDVILGEKNKIKSYASARYMQQKIADQLSLKIATLTLQMAMDAGRRPASAQASTSHAYANLVGLAGSSAANHLWQAVATMPLDNAMSGDALSWGTTDLQRITRAATAAAARKDPIVQEIRADLLHFCVHHKGVEAAHRTVRVTLSAVSLCPSVIGPAAQATLFGYLAVTGGPEQSKLLKELYLDKRLSSRAQLLSEESHLAFESYQMAAVTHNAVLGQCAAQMIKRLAGPATARALLCRAGGNS